MLFPTTLVGSYPQPEWLIDRKKLAGRFPPRVRALELWRVDPQWLEEAQDDATLLAIRDQERAGLDIVTDGEMRRESYSNRFANALAGVDLDNPGTALDRSGHPNPVPRVVGPIRRPNPVQVRDTEFLRANTDRTIKVTVPGPFTMSQQAQNDPVAQRAAFWITGLSLYVFWNVGTLLGALAGSAIDPKTFGLDAAFPAGYVAMLWPLLKDGRGRLAAAIGAAICLALIPFVPVGIPILCAALAVLVGVRR